MILQKTPAQLDEWRSSMYQYERQKRTKKPFGKESKIYQEHKIVHAFEIKEKERKYDPVLQKFLNQKNDQQLNQKQDQKRHKSLLNHIEKTKRHQKKYDIVNLHENINTNSLNKSININPETSEAFDYDEFVKSKNKNNPIRNVYNIINNQSLPSSYFKNRQIYVSNKPSQKKVYKDKYIQNQFDIVKSRYKDNHSEKQFAEAQENQQKVYEKLNKQHIYDRIYQRYYNEDKEGKYQQELNKQMIEHGKSNKYEQSLPPSYRNREHYLMSYIKSNGEIIKDNQLPESIRLIQQKEQKALRGHQLKYAIEQQYKKRNEEDYERRQRNISSKVHGGKILQHMIKEHNIINNKLYELENRSNMFEKKLLENPYSYSFVRSNNMQKNRVNSRGSSQFNKDLNKKENDWERYSAYSARSGNSSNSISKKSEFIKSRGFD